QRGDEGREEDEEDDLRRETVARPTPFGAPGIGHRELPGPGSIGAAGARPDGVSTRRRCGRTSQPGGNPRKSLQRPAASSRLRALLRGVGASASAPASSPSAGRARSGPGAPRSAAPEDPMSRRLESRSEPAAPAPDAEAEAALAKLREAIDRVDRELLRLFNERAALVQEVGRLKARTGLPVYSAARERDLLAALRAA